MKSQFYIYLHCKPNGDTFYVGKGSGLRSHKFTGRNQHHKNIVAKYGRENIGVFIFPCESEAQAHFDEIQKIAQLRQDGYELANLCDGGEGVSGRVVSAAVRSRIAVALTGRKRPPETIAKMAASKTGKKQSQESRAKRSLSMMGHPGWTKGKPAWNKGIKATKEACMNMSAAKKGKKLSPETRAKIGASGMGRIHSVETRAKMSKPKSAETRAKMSASNKGKPKSLAHCAAIKKARNEYLNKKENLHELR